MSQASMATGADSGGEAERSADSQQRASLSCVVLCNASLVRPSVHWSPVRPLYPPLSLLFLPPFAAAATRRDRPQRLIDRMKFVGSGCR